MAETEKVVWLHDYSLSGGDPALEENPGAAPIFVFDAARMESEGTTFKQVVFLYECLLDVPGVAIRRGDEVEEIAGFAAEKGASVVATTYSVSPRFARTVGDLRDAGLEVEIVRPPEFVVAPENLDLKRFSRYWRRVKKRAMNP